MPNLPEKRADLPSRGQEPEPSPYEKLSPVQRMVLHDVAEGMEVPELARKYYRRLMANDGSPQEVRIKKARTRLRRWLASQTFRDALWDWSIRQADIASPQILAGVVRKAAAGRVDAARLILEITGRHAPNTDVQPAAIQLVFNGVPRPQGNQPPSIEVDEDVIDGEIEVDDEAV